MVKKLRLIIGPRYLNKKQKEILERKINLHTLSVRSKGSEERLVSTSGQPLSSRISNTINQSMGDGRSARASLPKYHNYRVILFIIILF